MPLFQKREKPHPQRNSSSQELLILYKCVT
jgi:hypothetical protein